MTLADIFEKLSDIEDPAEVKDRIDEISELVAEMQDYLEDLDDVDMQDMADDYFDRWSDSEEILDDPASFLDETNDLIAEARGAGILND